MNEAEIIREMRKAVDVLKNKFSEAAGAGLFLDFMEAAEDEGHWMRIVARAEELSDPYMVGANEHDPSL